MKNVIGIDIGGTKINFALINEEGKILEYENVKAKDTPESVIKALAEGIARFEDRAEAVGIGMAGFINSDDGIIEFWGNLEGFTGLHLKEKVEEHTDLPVFIENDANIAALCEKWLGSAKDYKNFVMLTMGTGLGGAVYDENLGFWSGASYQGAELGHIIMYPGGRQCTCGQRGCAEKYVAGSALSINYEEITGERLSGEEIIDRHTRGDENAAKALKKFEEDMGIFLATMKNIFDPEGIILGGGFIEAKEHYWDGVIGAYKKQCNRTEGMEIKAAKFKNDAGVIGAAKLAFDRMAEDA